MFFPLFNLIEDATIVHKCTFVLVYVPVLNVPLSFFLVWIKASSSHFKGDVIWLMYGCPKDSHSLQQGFEVSSSFLDYFWLTL